MKNNYFKHLFTALLLLCSSIATAYEFKADGVIYNITDSINKTVEIAPIFRGVRYEGDIVIPENVTFNDVTYSVTSIGEEAFFGCTGLTSITIPNSVTSIGDYAFRYCTGLTSITIPNSVTSIGDYAFYGCTQLKTIYNFSNLIFTKGVSDHGDIAYYADEVINVPNGVFVGNFVFSTIDNIHTLVKYMGNDYEIVLPENYNGENYKIGDGAFENCTSLTSIEIPNSVTSIGGGAFSGCTGLANVYIEDITAWCNIDFADFSSNPLYYADNLYLNGEMVTDLVIPEGVADIKAFAFYRCSGLTSIEIPNNVTSIGKSAFLGCTSLISIEIPNSVTSIGESAFSGCTSLISIEIPNSVTSIGYYAFNGCTGLTSIIIEEGNSKYDSRNNCNAIIETGSNMLIAGCKNTIIPNSVTSIGDYAFSRCTGLASITIPNSVTGIEYGAFYGCTGLTSITIPNSVTSIGNYAFENCTGLTSITIPNSVTTIGSRAFSGCTGLTSITIPNSVTTIGSSAFSGCTGLTSITIPNSVTSIGDYAFGNCTGLTSIEIPNSVTSIGANAFSRCTGLTSITSYIPLESIIYNAPDFLGLESFDICTIYVPYGTAWAYERYLFCKNVVEKAMTASNLDALYNEVLEYANAIIDDNEFKSHGVISDSTQLSTNAQEKTEGPISNLLDSDIETFFHSSWSAESDPVNGYHYLQVDLGEALDVIEIKYSKRMNNTMKDYNPEYVEVSATNNVDGEWTLIGNYHWEYDFMTDTVEAGHATYVMDNAYRYIRITVKRNIGSYTSLTTPPFFNLSEFGVWESVFDTSHPTYSGVPAMLMDELQAAMAEAKEKLSAREHSEATFNRLKKAFNDVVEFKTTGIEELKTENGKVKAIYDLQGRRVKEANQPGIYIINGKKTLIK